MSDYEGRDEDETDLRKAYESADFRSSAALGFMIVALIQTLPTGIAAVLVGGTAAAAIVWMTSLGSLVLAVAALWVGEWLARRRASEITQRIRDRSAKAACDPSEAVQDRSGS